MKTCRGCQIHFIPSPMGEGNLIFEAPGDKNGVRWL
jgi:hypothetical protein